MKSTNTMTEGFQLIHDVFRMRWIPEIISVIGQGYHGYNEILGQIDFLSNTELNRKLKLLLDRQVIDKIENQDQHGYYLNAFGEDLDHIFKHFIEMSEKYIKK
ncbi:winged helix-turn-helix transcriptional regulator [Fusibacter ferrireducens]|uniref:Winged helix-turn-helix transcriptional regulator n=1 Tax=Fusibacter ferrireducens TaxID=2785058 RepID=A0ABR9ZZU5_9FIRM|nr:winged helix-turn-helix transcriptional regulator [Fusibacter ferrireducens]MBF4695964.1 winged helix-turn-helix transcriptional regulator [Fusibacter ferrireducens]